MISIRRLVQPLLAAAVVLLVPSFVTTSVAAGQSADTRYEQRSLTLPDGTAVGYGLSIPKAQAPAGGYPLILGLHFSPGLGPTPEKYGLRFIDVLVRPALEPLGAVIVAPDAPEGGWTTAEGEAAVLAVLDAVKQAFPIDGRRTLVTGYSMGGFGTWFFAARHPELFRAALPMASLPVLTASDGRQGRAAVVEAIEKGDASWTAQVKATPFYVIHSRNDQVVPFAPLARAVEMLKEAGGDVTFVPLDRPSHYDTGAYVEPLAAAVPWIETVWRGGPR
ncbi:MAG: prolyl oligopeptidase family serine peptidase [Vicinamibacterales bacterium]